MDTDSSFGWKTDDVEVPFSFFTQNTKTTSRTILSGSVETLRFMCAIVYEEIAFFIYFGYTCQKW